MDFLHLLGMDTVLKQPFVFEEKQLEKDGLPRLGRRRSIVDGHPCI